MYFMQNQTKITNVMLWPSSVAFRFIAVLFLSVSNLSSQPSLAARTPVAHYLSVDLPQPVQLDLGHVASYDVGLTQSS